MVPEIIAATLLESDLSFVGDYTSRNLDFDVSGGPSNGTFEHGHMHIEWEIELDVRKWGIKDIVLNIKSLKIDLMFANEVPDNDDWRIVDHEITLVYPTPNQPQRPKDEADIAAMAKYYANKPVEAVAVWGSEMTRRIYPVAVNIDLRLNRVEVEFG